MDNDKELDAWLNAYQVKPADNALLERIITQAEASSTPQFRRSSILSQMRRGAVAAAIAFLGFWLGNVTTPVTTTTAMATTPATAQSTTQGVNVDTVILGPQSVYEVML